MKKKVVADKLKYKYILSSQVLSFLILSVLILRVFVPKDINFLNFTYSAVTFLILIPLIPLIQVLNFRNDIIIDSVLNISYILFTTFLLIREDINLFKLLLIMPIVIAAIKYGLRISLYFAITSIMGLLYISYIKNFYTIDADILLIGVMLLVAWLLGNMTETEAQIRSELERLATHDSLTNIYNHRTFHNLIEEQIEKAKANNKNLSLMLIDLDYFKVYNDSYGHQKGDLVLKEIAQIMVKVIGNLGFCARYGGEEFAVILPELDIDRAKKLGEKIRTDIEELSFPGVEVLPSGKLTVSIGIAEFPSMADNKEKLIHKADMALYKAKFVNKDKVETYFSVFDELALELKAEEEELLNSIRTLTMVVNAKDRYTYGHSERTMEMAKKLAERIGLSKKEVKDIMYGALLHDIGKIEVDRQILNKPTKLTNKEWNILKKHPQWGADIIRPLKSLQGSLNVILYHHENFDGTGYPEGLKGKEIPLGARILRIVDSFDAMTTNRPYKIALTKKQALEELKRHSGSHYDPFLLEEFIEIVLENKVT